MEFEAALEQLSEERLTPFTRVELGAFTFTDTVGRLASVRRLLTSATRVDRSDLPNEFRQQATIELEALTPILNSLQNFDPKQGNPNERHTQIGNDVAALQRRLVELLGIYVSSAAAGDMSKETALVHQVGDSLREGQEKLEALTTELQVQRDEYQQLLLRLQQAAGESASGQLAHYYDDQAKRHRTASNWFGGAALLLAVAAAGVSVVWFADFDPNSAAKQTPGSIVEVSSNGDLWRTFIHELLIRSVAIGIASYVLALLVRSYRVNQHLRSINEQKRNALHTYQLFASTAVSEAARDLVTAEVVRAVFSTSETGFLAETGDKTIVESTTPMGALNLLSRLQPNK